MAKAKFCVRVLVLCLIVSTLSFGEEHNDKSGLKKLASALTNSELEEMEVGLERWENQEMIEMLSKQGVTDKSVSSLYQYFKEIVISPPDPDAYTEYSIENAEVVLMQTKLLGRTLHNLFLSLNDEDFTKYGKLIGLMRNVLYIDSQHIPLAIKHDNSRDVYWRTVHTKGVEDVEEEYKKLFGVQNN